MGGNLYTILGLFRNCTQDDIKRAYRRSALLWHPDKNLTNKEEAEKKFKEITEAYSILIDPSKRRHYDQYGEKGYSTGKLSEDTRKARFTKFKSEFRPESNPFDTFREVFGSDNPFNVREELPTDKFPIFTNSKYRNRSKTSNSIPKPSSSVASVPNFHPVNDYEGYFKDSPNDRKSRKTDNSYYDILCTLEEISTGCNKVLKINRKKKDRLGNSYLCEKKKLEVYITPGLKEGSRLVYENEGDEGSGLLPGDIIFIVKILPHERFRRDKYDLHMTYDVNVIEALSGFRAKIELLNMKILILNINKVITPSSVEILYGEGLPRPKSPDRKGNLVVHFNVIFPNQVSQENIDKLKSINLFS